MHRGFWYGVRVCQTWNNRFLSLTTKLENTYYEEVNSSFNNFCYFPYVKSCKCNMCWGECFIIKALY